MNPNDLGKKFIAEQCERVEISSLLKVVKQELKELILNSQLELEGFDISLLTSSTGFGGTRYWFECPLCRARVGVIFKHPILKSVGCRKYSKRRYKGMVENEIYTHLRK